MKSKLENNPHENNFVRRIGDVLLFVRAANESELSKLSNGKPKEAVLLKPKGAHNSLYNFMRRKDLEKTYELTREFDFNFSCYEIVILKTFYQNFKEFLEKTLIQNPTVTFDEFLQFQYTPQPEKAVKKAGRKADDRNPTILNMFHAENKTHREVGEHLAEMEREKLKREYKQQGLSEAESTEKIDRIVDEKWIEQAIRKSKSTVAGKNKRDKKVGEKLKP